MNFLKPWKQWCYFESGSTRLNYNGQEPHSFNTHCRGQSISSVLSSYLSKVIVLSWGRAEVHSGSVQERAWDMFMKKKF